MSLEAGRVGVRPDQLDNYGRINPNSQFIQNLLNDLPAWTDLPVWVDGTEQLLPVNDDEPETSPIKCDITYPIADEKTGQYFTYRESPTQKDGLAKIRGIKGNTLVWNQLVANGNFVNYNNWYARQATFTVSDNIATVTPSTEGTERGMFSASFPVKANHKYLLSCEIKPPASVTCRITFGGSINYGFDKIIPADVWSKCQGTVLNDTDRTVGFYALILNSLTPSQTIQFKNMMVIDLTQIGLDSITDPDEFNSLFPLSYYKYNTGSLLNFAGTKLRTTSKNLLSSTFEQGTINGQTGEVGTSTTRVVSDYVYLYAGDYICSNYSTKDLYIAIDVYDLNKTFDATLSSTLNTWSQKKKTFSLTEPMYVRVLVRFNNNSTIKATDVPMIQIEHGSVQTSYVSAEENETDLPISTFFPTGMKSAGTVYDELTPTRAITRVDEYTCDGTDQISWALVSHYGLYSRFDNNDVKAKKGTSNFISNLFNAVTIGTENEGMSFHGSDGHLIIQILTSKLATDNVSGLMTYFSNNTYEVNYELSVEDVQPTMSFGD